MFQTSFFQTVRILILCMAVALPAFAAGPQKADDEQKQYLDIRSCKGDLHVGKDADAAKAGFPLYPGARLRHSGDDDRNGFNFDVLSEAFGIKLVVANYDSDDAPGKIIEYYRAKLKKYGKVLECHSREHGGNVNASLHDEKHASKELECDDNSGPVTELKVGTEDNQHLAAVEPGESGRGSTFALVYVYARVKQADI